MRRARLHPGALASVAIAVLLASPAAAATLGCTPTAELNWRAGAALSTYLVDEERGMILFGLDLETGQYTEHRLGSRAGVTGGGTFQIIEQRGVAPSQDFVGVDLDDSAFIRVDLTTTPSPYLRLFKEGGADIGTCVPGDLDTAVEGTLE